MTGVRWQVSATARENGNRRLGTGNWQPWAKGSWARERPAPAHVQFRSLDTVRCGKLTGNQAARLRNSEGRATRQKDAAMLLELGLSGSAGVAPALAATRLWITLASRQPFWTPVRQKRRTPVQLARACALALPCTSRFQQPFNPKPVTIDGRLVPTKFSCATQVFARGCSRANSCVLRTRVVARF